MVSINGPHLFMYGVSSGKIINSSSSTSSSNSNSIEDIHSVGTINNVETSYFTRLKYVT